MERDKVRILQFVNAPRELSVHDVYELVGLALAHPGAKVAFLENVSWMGDCCALWAGDSAATEEEVRSALVAFTKEAY